MSKAKHIIDMLEEENDYKYEIVQTVDNKWMILVDGVQWGEHRDRSGSGDYEAETREEAEKQLQQLKSEEGNYE